MGFTYSDNNGNQTFIERRSRFEEADAGRNLRIRETESSLLAVRKELEDVRLDPLPLDSKLKKTGLSGYRRSSVEAYVDELKRSTSQLKDNMEQQIQSLSAECMRLKSESQLLRGQLVQAEEQTSQVRDMLAQVTDERDAAEHRVTAADAELRSMEERLSVYESGDSRTDELECLLREKTEELDSAAAENEHLREQINDFSEEIQHIYDEFDKYKDKKSAEGEEIACLKQQLSLLREDNEQLQTELDGAKQELDRFTDRDFYRSQIRLQEENAELMEKYSSLYSEYKKELARSNGLTNENEALSQRLEEYMKTERENETLRKKDREQHTAIDELQKLINGLLEEAQHQQELFDRLSAERSENKELIYSLTHDRSDLHVQNVDLQVQNVELLDKNEELTKQVQRLEEENAELNQRLKQKQPPVIIPMLQSEQSEADEISSDNRYYDTVKKVRSLKNYNR